MYPQQYAAPEEVSPQLWPAPTYTRANAIPPDTATGTLPHWNPAPAGGVQVSVVGAPSCPRSFAPQQYATPPDVTPHVCCPDPALREANEMPPDTGVGTTRPVRPDPAALLDACALLLGVAVVAAYLPARRATRIDPARALRAE